MLTLEAIKGVIAPIAEELDLRRVIVFGSYARGEQGENSDIDLVIDSGGTLKGFEVLCAVGKLVKALPLRADIFELSEVKNPSETYTAIQQEGVVIYEG
ncbi:MAG: nucleotidyltransferase domain-containing protein [Defluviitaleaceae bacterium]|nr:nucleotidyltransferase domain-containing protein [Defluviitaleaceae bacterium]